MSEDAPAPSKRRKTDDLIEDDDDITAISTDAAAAAAASVEQASAVEQYSIQKIGVANGDDEEEEDQFGEEVAKPKLFAVVCSSNMNRSMEAHFQLARKGMNVMSYGVGTKVRLPAAGNARGISFDFGVPYEEILESITAAGNLSWYHERGISQMLERNVKIKQHPERFQDFVDVASFDIIVCFEERVFDLLVDDLNSREPGEEVKLVHAINLDVKDTAEDSIEGGKVILDLCSKVEAAVDLQESLPDIIEAIETQYHVNLLYLQFYL